MYDHHLVIAHYQESLDWLFTLLKSYSNIKAFIYNDGPAIYIPKELTDRILIKEGDKIPAESTKYMQYILDYYDNPNKEIRVTFLQGDPIYHSPELFKIFEHVELWDKNYQNLNLYAHPPPWQHSHAIINNNIENIKRIGNGRTWTDIMKNTFQGVIGYDEYINTIMPQDMTIPYMCSYLAIKNVNPNKIHIKAYSACFSTTWERIYSFEKDLWLRIINFITSGENSLVTSSTQKVRAIIMEYMWAVIFHDGDIVISK